MQLMCWMGHGQVLGRMRPLLRICGTPTARGKLLPPLGATRARNPERMLLQNIACAALSATQGMKEGVQNWQDRMSNVQTLQNKQQPKQPLADWVREATPPLPHGLHTLHACLASAALCLCCRVNVVYCVVQMVTVVLRCGLDAATNVRCISSCFAQVVVVRWEPPVSNPLEAAPVGYEVQATPCGTHGACAGLVAHGAC
eukprot:1159106-Pelagomonas_calceolata.AAC.8